MRARARALNEWFHMFLELWFLTATDLGLYLLPVGCLFHTDEDVPDLYLSKSHSMSFLTVMTTYKNTKTFRNHSQLVSQLLI